MRNLSEKPPTSFYLASGVAILSASLNLLWVTIYLGGLFQSNSVSAAQGGTGWLVDQSMVRMHLVIEAALIIAALGLLSRKLMGLTISLLALLWIGIEYAGWFIWTQRTIEAAGLTEIPRLTSHAGDLYGATGWNLIILVVASALFIWEAKTLTGALPARKKGTSLEGQ